MNYFAWTTLGIRVNKYINFCLQVHFKVSAPWYWPRYLPPMSLIPEAICHRRCWHRPKFAAGIIDTSGKFATHVKNTSGTGGKIWCRCRWYQWQICHWCQRHPWCTLICEYLREFLKKFELTLKLFSGAWGKLIHEKKTEAKNTVTLSL